MSHGAKIADCATEVAALHELPVVTLNTLLFSACVIDKLAGWKADTLFGVSMMSLYIAIPLAIFAASGSVYSHRILNTNHQDPTAETHGTHEALADAPPTSTTTALSLFQKSALAGDWYGHMAEFAALGTTLLTLFLNTTDLPRPALAAIYLGICAIAAYASYGNFRTCLNNMKEYNEANPRTKTSWSIWAAPAKAEVYTSASTAGAGADGASAPLMHTG